MADSLSAHLAAFDDHVRRHGSADAPEGSGILQILQFVAVQALGIPAMKDEDLPGHESKAKADAKAADTKPAMKA